MSYAYRVEKLLGTSVYKPFIASYCIIVNFMDELLELNTLCIVCILEEIFKFQIS